MNKINLYDKANLFNILMVVLMSGTAFFTLLNDKICLVILAIGTLAVLYFKKYISKYNIIVFCMLSILILLNSLINISNHISIVKLGSLLLKLFCTMIICSNIDKKTFKRFYINIIEVMCIISLICFSLSYIIQFKQFPLYRYQIISGQYFMFSFYHTWGWQTAFNRNAGMFWEPGAFEIYINIALIFLLDNNSIEKKDIFKVVLFIITIITTKSTTGYLVLLLVLIYMIAINLRKIIKEKDKKITYAVIAIVLFSCCLIYLNKNVIINKISGSNASYNIRMRDLYVTSSLISNKPLVGYGYYSEKYINLLAHYNIINNSNGLLYFCGMFGLIILVIFFILMNKNFKNILDKFSPILFMAIIIIMYLSEYVILMPFFMLFLYKFNENEQ